MEIAIGLFFMYNVGNNEKVTWYLILHIEQLRDFRKYSFTITK